MPTLRTAPTWQSQVRYGRGFIGRVEHAFGCPLAAEMLDAKGSPASWA